MEPVLYCCVNGATLVAKVAINYLNAKCVNESIRRDLDRLQIANESIKDFLGLIRSDIQSMMHMYFRSAYENLNYALNANANNKKDYLIQARNRFIGASTIEKNDNLILTYLGLAFCQELLDDIDNSNITLGKIKLVEWEDIYSDNPDVLLKDWDSGWQYIERQIFIKIIIACKFSSMEFNPHYIIDNKLSGWPCNEYLKDVYHQRFNALIKCGWPLLKITTEEEYCKEYDNIRVKAEKLIRQENFSTLKQQVISSFKLSLTD